MPLPRISDTEFIAVWQQHLSPSGVAKALGMSVRHVCSQRRKIEARRGVRLLTYDATRLTYNSAMSITADRVEVKLTLENGVIIVGSDAHYWPGSISTMHKAFCHLAKELKPFAKIMNGDAFDGSSNSRFASIGWESKPEVKAELDACKARMWELKKAGTGKTIWTAGNHDLRFETFLAANAPQYRGVDGIHLKDHFPEWTPAWFVTVNEGTPSHTEIRHREKGGIHASYNNTKESGVTIVTGHDHRADVVPYDDRRGRRYGVRAGMMAQSCRDPQFVNYLEGKTTNWQSALAVLTYKDGRLMQPELVLGWDADHVQFRGQVINVSKGFKPCDL